MRKRIIHKNEDSTKYKTKTRTIQLIHVQRYLAETHVHRQVERPRYRRHSLVYSVRILSTAKFPERFRINSKRYYFYPQKQTSSPEGESIRLQR